MIYNYNKTERKKKKIRQKILKQEKYRLTVYKSNKHIYAQLYKPDGSKVIESMSSLSKAFKEKIREENLTNLTKIEKSKLVGKLLSEKLKFKNLNNIVFDRSGFKFHGRIKAIADAIKESGIKI